MFLTLDANSRYWQLEMDEADMDKTSFVTHNGPHRYNHMPFGLRNAPVAFQKEMNVFLATLQRQHALVYIYDIIFFSPTPEDRTGHVESVIRLIYKAGMTLKLKKCYFI